MFGPVCQLGVSDEGCRRVQGIADGSVRLNVDTAECLTRNELGPIIREEQLTVLDDWVQEPAVLHELDLDPSWILPVRRMDPVGLSTLSLRQRLLESALTSSTLGRPSVRQLLATCSACGHHTDDFLGTRLPFCIDRFASKYRG